MKTRIQFFLSGLRGLGSLVGFSAVVLAAEPLEQPRVTRLNPPSLLFAQGQTEGPMIARFLPGQRFDLQATISLPDAAMSVREVRFFVDQELVAGATSLTQIDQRRWSALRRAFSLEQPGVHRFEFRAECADGTKLRTEGQFEIVALTERGEKVKNVILLIGDGMGPSHRTAARILGGGVDMGKARQRLAMDQFPVTGMVMTSSLNSIVTDSAPGAASYATGNKCDNNQLNVFPDDTAQIFDNPRVETMAEYLARRKGTALGIVTTADVFDATPAAFGVHSQDRSAGTGICDQFLDEAVAQARLTVLMGGGRKWFLADNVIGSMRSGKNDAQLPEELATGWGVAGGAIDPQRDLLGDFRRAGFAYAANRAALDQLFAAGVPPRLLGLFHLGNMNVAKDKIDGRRGQSTVVSDYGFPDQPMLDEMTQRALQVLEKQPNGFLLMVEGASIDKQSHNMDTERWLLDVLELDRAIQVAREFQAKHPDTLVIVTADHECGGVAVIGGSTQTQAMHQKAAQGGGVKGLRDELVGIHEDAGFPRYVMAADGYPQSTDIDHKMLIGYAANADRHEDWLTNARPVHDPQQPLDTAKPLSGYPRINSSDAKGEINAKRPLRDEVGGFMVTGQIPGAVAAHTACDIPLSAQGRGAEDFTGYMDNTEVFFRIMQNCLGGAAK